MHYRHDNVITLRTFSKIYGLAGARIGYGFAHERLISNLMKVKLTFEPSSLAEVLGIAALRDKAFLHRSLELNVRSMQLLYSGLVARGYAALRSEANFVMVDMKTPEAAAAMTWGLLKRGIIIRALASFGLPACIRISAGTLDDTEQCLRAMDEASAEEKLTEALVT
jgi:histidinol-phosphate aminotransferase